MENNIMNTMELLGRQKALKSELDSLLWGSLEVRENGKLYVYLHRRESGMRRTFYVGEFSEELQNRILTDNLKAKAIKKQLREISAALKRAGYVGSELTDKIKTNIDYAKRSLVDTIYKQAVLEGVAVTFMDTETIIEGGKINNVTADDVQKINNLKHAWQFILDEGVITSKPDLSLLCLINRLVEEGFYYNAGKLRSVPVSIGGTKWKPGLPIESQIKEQLADILDAETDIYAKAIRALLFVTKKQLFIDGNKRTSVIFANHILISHGAGLLAIPEDMVAEYKQLLINYYETDDAGAITALLERCLTKLG